jgi:aspartyl-tRNA(Asn)/glutamyl-tRNA(Gln) amidotransferase subunit A
MTRLDDSVAYLSVKELGDAIRTKALSPVKVVKAALERIERIDDPETLNAFVTVTGDEALWAAGRAEEEIRAGKYRGPLHGIPYGLKDLVDTRGIATTFGARPFADRIPDRDATVHKRLQDAGAILLGKLSMIELAGGLRYTYPDAAFNGPCRTPWDRARWAGGSSSGSAAAVAAGLVAFAIGSETWGSITCPASFCGVTGLRPTYGVVSRHGAMALSFTLDKLGPICRSAEDCAVVLHAIAGRDPLDASSVDAPAGLDRVSATAVAPGLKAALVDLPAGYPVDPEVRKAFDAALVEFRRAGVLLEPTQLPDFPYEWLAVLFIEAEVRAAFDELIRTGRTSELSDRSHRAATVTTATAATAADYVKAMQIRTKLQEAMSAFFERYDILISPTIPFVAPKIDQNIDDLFGGLSDPVGAGGNLAGLPCVALPYGFAGPGKLPLGMQVVGRPFDEARVLSVAALYQSRTTWHRERPPIS